MGSMGPKEKFELSKELYTQILNGNLEKNFTQQGDAYFWGHTLIDPFEWCNPSNDMIISHYNGIRKIIEIIHGESCSEEKIYALKCLMSEDVIKHLLSSEEEEIDKTTIKVRVNEVLSSVGKNASTIPYFGEDTLQAKKSFNSAKTN